MGNTSCQVPFAPDYIRKVQKRGTIALTIFVKPDGGGSQVQIFTEGLSWDGK
jgi:hypothetical protein